MYIIAHFLPLLYFILLHRQKNVKTEVCYIDNATLPLTNRKECQIAELYRLKRQIDSIDASNISFKGVGYCDVDIAWLHSL